jgi:CDP-paratose 2-epimerase
LLSKHSIFHHEEIDIRDYEALADVIKRSRPDIIFNLAGQVAMTTSIQNPRMDFEVNAMGTLNVLEAVRLFSPETGIIYSSTNKVYGDLARYEYQVNDTRYIMPQFSRGIDEEVTLDFHSPYGCSKGSADQYILDYARIYGLKTIVFRHSSMYGGHQFSTIDQGWIGWFCEQALLQKMGHSKNFTISGNGKQVRDILNSKDMIDLYIQASQHITIMSGNAFNIGGGMDNSLSIIELVHELENILGIGIHYEHTTARESDQLFFVANLGKIQQYINWAPKVNFQQGLPEMLNWVESNIRGRYA